VYEKLAEKAHDEPTRKLLLRYAEEEKCHFVRVRAYYDQLADKVPASLILPEITVFDFYTSLLECITYKIADIDKYKTFSTKIQSADLRGVFLQILQSKVRQGFGLLVLITPEEIPLEL
jgi:rubrerythrin